MRGLYVLIIKVKNNFKTKVGSLGEIEFKKGYYCYVGSANGKNLEIDDRIRRYFILNKTKEGKLRWHIDYLLVRPEVEIVDVIKFKNGNECKLAEKISKLCLESIPEFGCSDCNCESHLFFHYQNPKKKIINFFF
ncbi:MAG: GIY-YIG nuclease family protein [Candidatus Aenigmatarchaeota archaeon]